MDQFAFVTAKHCSDFVAEADLFNSRLHRFEFRFDLLNRQLSATAP